MKRVLLGIFILALLFSAFPAVLAEPLCDPSEVDLSGIEEIDGRLVGEIRVPDGLLRGQLLIDCPLPESFTQEQSQTLTVQYKRISEKEMIAALQAVGQKGSADTVYIYNSNPQTWAEFSLLKRGDPGYYFDGYLMNAAASADPAYEMEYTQAKRLVQALIAQLGGISHEGLLHAIRLDAEHIDLRSPTADSDGAVWREQLTESFAQTEKESGLTPNTLTMVNGPYELYGLPVMRNIEWMQGRDRMGAESAYFAAVHDDGTLQYCLVECLPVVTDTASVSLPVRGWRELLSECIANGWCTSTASSEDCTTENCVTGEPVTAYASYAIITELHPCWVGNAKDRLVPGYYLNAEKRVIKDDSLIYPKASYGDAETLTGIH